MPPPRIRSQALYLPSITTTFSLLRRVVTGLALSSSFNYPGSTWVAAAPLDPRDHSTPEFAFKLVLSIVFVLLGGVFSGLSLGLMGLDHTNLRVLAASGSPQDRTDARKVLSLLGHGRHFVLVCLLLSNVIVNETLPIFLDSITGGGGLWAVLISSALIFFAGEVLPQSICSRYGMRIGAKCVNFVKVLMYLESPVCWPTAKLLDFLLGSHHSHMYRRDELKTLVELHSTGAASQVPFEDGSGVDTDGLSELEVRLATSALCLRDAELQHCMRRVDAVYTVNDGMRICDVDLREVLVRSQRYIPVRRASRQGGNGVFVGLITTKQLVVALGRPNDTIRSLQLDEMIQVLPSTSLAQCLSYTQDHDPSTVFVVSASSIRGAEAVGFATVDDIGRHLIDRSPGPRSSTLATPVALSSARGRGSVSIGIGAFVRGIVERHRSHRASASELSFQLSSDSDDQGYHPLRTSYSHHRTHSQSSIPLTRDIAGNRPITSSGSRLPSGRGLPGGGATFKFPSPVLEQEDSFTLGDEEETEEDVGTTDR
ncbi:hypothetical protein JCM11491_004917 [Sporobolomyces phaffii]